MRGKLLIILFAGILSAGCAKEAPPPGQSPQSGLPGTSPAGTSTTPPNPAAVTANTVKPKVDACSLLTPSEIQAIQGEAPSETKLSGQNSGGLAISQCFFTLPTYSNSVSLIVAHKADGDGAREPKEFWRSTFKESKESRKEEKGGREEEGSHPPKKVGGIGDDAFWTGNKIAGALYVLKGDAYLRVSVGGSSDQARQTQARAIAQKALARLQ